MFSNCSNVLVSGCTIIVGGTIQSGPVWRPGGRFGSINTDPPLNMDTGPSWHATQNMDSTATSQGGVQPVSDTSTTSVTIENGKPIVWHLLILINGKVRNLLSGRIHMTTRGPGPFRMFGWRGKKGLDSERDFDMGAESEPESDGDEMSESDKSAESTDTLGGEWTKAEHRDSKGKQSCLAAPGSDVSIDTVTIG